MRHVMRFSLAAAIASMAFVLAACGGPSVPIDQALAVEEVVTGYHDGGTAAGQNRLLPTISFRVRNTTDRTISAVQFNAVFRVVGEEEELGSQLIRGLGGDGLAPGETSQAFVLRSTFGYSGEQGRAEMFQHQGFQDVQVELFAKAGGAQWVKLLEQLVDRQLLDVAQ
jgi:hypothetical protein